MLGKWTITCWRWSVKSTEEEILRRICRPPRKWGSPWMTVEVFIVNWGQMSKKPCILIKDFKQKLTGISSSYSVQCLQVLLLWKLVCVTCYMVKMEPVWTRCGVRLRRIFSCHVPAHSAKRWQLLLGRDVEWELLFVWNQLISWVLLCVRKWLLLILRVQLFYFARDGERVTLAVKIRSCGILARAAFLRGTEPLPLESTQASEHCQYVILTSKWVDTEFTWESVGVGNDLPCCW